MFNNLSITSATVQLGRSTITIRRTAQLVVIVEGDICIPPYAVPSIGTRRTLALHITHNLGGLRIGGNAPGQFDPGIVSQGEFEAMGKELAQLIARVAGA